METEQYRGKGLGVLVPRLIRQTSTAERRKRSGSRRATGEFDKDWFFSSLKENSSVAAAATARRILVCNREKGLRIWGGADSLLPMKDIAGQGYRFMEVQGYRFMEVKNRGSVQFRFCWMKHPYGSAAKREALRLELNSMSGVDIPASRLSGKPEVPLPGVRQRVSTRRA